MPTRLDTLQMDQELRECVPRVSIGDRHKLDDNAPITHPDKWTRCRLLSRSELNALAGKLAS